MIQNDKNIIKYYHLWGGVKFGLRDKLIILSAYIEKTFN